MLSMRYRYMFFLLERPSVREEVRSHDDIYAKEKQTLDFCLAVTNRTFPHTRDRMGKKSLRKKVSFPLSRLRSDR